MKYDLLYESLHDSLMHSKESFAQVRKLYQVLTRLLDTRASYEIIFREARESGFDLGHVFREENLIKHFGLEAVQHSRETKFSEHMGKVLKSTSSYFRDLIFHGAFQEPNAPPFLTNNRLGHLSRLASFETLAKDGILSLHQSDMITFLEKCQKKEQCYFIQFSNITDWMFMEKRHHLLTLSWNCLFHEGKLVTRRFNGDYNLISLLESFGFATKIEHDQSEFYPQVVVATKKQQAQQARSKL